MCIIHSIRVDCVTYTANKRMVPNSYKCDMREDRHLMQART